MTRAQRIAEIRRQMTVALREGKMGIYSDLAEGLAILLRAA
jgi:hypothetical protein